MMLTAHKASVGLDKGAAGVEMSAVVTEERTQKLTLASVGIIKDPSSRAQKIAAVSESEFEKQFGEWHENVTAEGSDPGVFVISTPAQR